MSKLARKTKEEQRQDKLTYMREQLERFVYKHYRHRPNIKVYMQKRMQTDKFRYSQTTFPEDIREKEGLIEVDFDYDMIRKKGRKFLLEIAFREAVRIGMWMENRPFVNGHPEFERELRRFGLPAFGNVAETGLDLHTYVCSGCQNVWILKMKKLPKSKDPVHKEYKTACCGTPFQYDGVKYYDNELLQRLQLELKKRRGG